MNDYGYLTDAQIRGGLDGSALTTSGALAVSLPYDPLRGWNRGYPGAVSLDREYVETLVRSVLKEQAPETDMTQAGPAPVGRYHLRHR